MSSGLPIVCSCGSTSLVVTRSGMGFSNKETMALTCTKCGDVVDSSHNPAVDKFVCWDLRKRMLQQLDRISHTLCEGSHSEKKDVLNLVKAQRELIDALGLSVNLTKADLEKDK